MKSILVLHVAIPVPLYQTFDYLAPADIKFEKIKIATRVRVVFGKRKISWNYCRLNLITVIYQITN